MEHERLSESINALHFNDFKVFLNFSESLMKGKRFQMVVFFHGAQLKSLCSKTPNLFKSQGRANAFDSLSQSIPVKLTHHQVLGLSAKVVSKAASCDDGIRKMKPHLL